MKNNISPDHILQVGFGFWASKTLLSAVELAVFSQLADAPKSGAELQAALGLHPRATFDFLDTLVALGLLERDGSGESARYANTPATALFLVKSSPQYVGGILEMANARLYRFWADLTTALKTGLPQNEIKETGKSMFEGLYADPARLEQFMDAMSGISMGNFAAFAEKFDFSTLQDAVRHWRRDRPAVDDCRRAASAHALPSLRSSRRAADRRSGEMRARDLDDRVTAETIDFFADEFPKADVITMGMILHDWNLENKKMLIAKAYRRAAGGRRVCRHREHHRRRTQRKTRFGLMMSLNMLIEFGEAFDFTGAQFAAWCQEAGFSRCEIIPLGGPGQCRGRLQIALPSLRSRSDRMPG